MKYYTVKQCSYEEAKYLILNLHYSHKMPVSVIFKFGLYYKDRIVGVVTYGRTSSPAPAKSLFGNEYRKIVYELNRLVMKPDHNGGNYTSFLVSHSLRKLPSGLGIISYADLGGQGHVGYIYRACNFLYTGTTKQRTDKVDIDGKHPRHYKKDSTKRRIRTSKCRYVIFTGSKTDKKRLKKLMRWKVEKWTK